jgi:hypothetical protein
MTQIMPSRAWEAIGESADLDPLGNECLHTALPGLRTALDANVIGISLQAHLLRESASVTSCTAGKALYLGVHGCSLRFHLEVRDGGSSSTRRLLVLGRLMEDDDDVERYNQAITPLADAVSGRAELTPFRHRVALLPQRLVVHAYPIDRDLPTLVDATDGARVARLLDQPTDQCTVALGHYGRNERCVLQYHVDGGRGRRTVYGKVCADDRGANVGPVLDALAERLPDRVTVPRFLGYVPSLRLSLLDELPGDRAQAQAMIDDAALVAAALHNSEIALGTPRPIEAEVAELEDLVLLIERVAPALGAAFHGLITAITAAAAETEPLAPVFSHGDFTPSQLLAGGARPGLVDFDAIAQAEPALDLGRFLAHLRLAVAKAQPSAHRETADRLADRFLATYVDAADVQTGAAHLRARARVYEALSLLRTTAHAWQKLKPARAQTVFPILCEEVASL